MSCRHYIGPLLAAAVGIAFAGCGGASNSTTARASSSGASSSGASSSGASSSGAISIKDFKFAPATVTVDGGTRLRVTNDDSTAHTATADAGGAFDTGTIEPSASKTFTLEKRGRYAYHCNIHPFMHGTIVVR